LLGELIREELTPSRRVLQLVDTLLAFMVNNISLNRSLTINELFRDSRSDAQEAYLR